MAPPRDEFPHEVTLHVRDTCLCLHTQRAARALARRFDDALRPLEVTNGQFSLLNSLNRAEAPSIGHVAAFLAMDRTTLTAALKPLERRGLVKVGVDRDDRRSRRLILTKAGHALLAKAVPLWETAHAEVEQVLSASDAGRLGADDVRAALQALS